MAQKKVNLAEVFKQNEEPQKPELEVVESPPTGKKKVAPSREKKKHIGGYFDEAVYRQMKAHRCRKGNDHARDISGRSKRFLSA